RSAEGRRPRDRATAASRRASSYGVRRDDETRLLRYVAWPGKSASPMTTPADVRRYLANWQGEVDSAAQYHAMAEGERQAETAKVYENLAAIEEKHASFWEERLRNAGRQPPPRKPSW